MIHEITPEEIARVDEIHYWMDRWQAFLGPPASHYAIPRTPVTFTAEEVRAWPKLKSALIAALRDGDQDLPVAFWCDWHCPPGPELYEVPQEHINSTRGLVMYRGSMAFLEATGQVEAPKVVKLSDALREHLLDRAFETKRYRANNPSREAMIAATQDADDIASGRRARLVAALAKELDRPAPVRFPHEGRSERAFLGRLR